MPLLRLVPCSGLRPCLRISLGWRFHEEKEIGRLQNSNERIVGCDELKLKSPFRENHSGSPAAYDQLFAGFKSFNNPVEDNFPSRDRVGERFFSNSQLFTVSVDA